MKNFAILIPFLAASLLTGCFKGGLRGDGNVISENRNIADISSVEASGGLDIQWTNGPAGLSIMTDSNLLAHLKTVVSGSALNIYSDESLSPTRGIKVLVSSSALKNLDLTGAINLTTGRISGSDLHISSTGADTIDVHGNVASLTAGLTGACQLKAANLVATNLDITMDGASSATVAVVTHLNAALTGACMLTYSGSPASVDQNLTGVCFIHHVP